MFNWADRLKYKWERWYWSILHRFHPKHRYNVIKPRSLKKPGYYDPDILILCTCMDLLAEYFETGAPQVVWDEAEHSRKIYAEMEEIYNWWTYEWPHNEEVKVNGELRASFPENWREVDIGPFVTAHHQDNEDWVAKEEEMLCRLMKIRPTLWY